MHSLHINCKPRLERAAKSLKSGAGYRIRTRGPLITKLVASLKSNDLFVNRAFNAPQNSVTLWCGVNRGVAA